MSKTRQEHYEPNFWLIPLQPPPIPRCLPRPLGKIVGLCGELVLDGRTSSGGAARSLSAYWHVSTAHSASLGALSAAMSALASFNGSLLARLNVTALEVNVTFDFTLSVENFLGENDKTTVSVVRRREKNKPETHTRPPRCFPLNIRPPCTWPGRGSCPNAEGNGMPNKLRSYLPVIPLRSLITLP